MIDSSGTVWDVGGRQGLSWVCVCGGGSPATIADVIMNGQQAQSGMSSPGASYWAGSLTVLPPGEEALATITFGQQNQSVNSRASAVGDKWDYEGELVVGVGVGKSGKYRLHNLMWNQLTIPK